MIKRISPCPIIEATIQINCTFAVNQDIVVGLIYSLLSKDEGNILNIERLPILNLPEDIRRADPNLKDKPWYKINCGQFFICIGLYGVSLGVNPPYESWKSFKDFASKIFLELKGAVIKGISSINLKYLNFFVDINIFEKINCQFILKGERITAVPSIFRTELQEDKFVKILQIANGAHLVNKALKIDADGSILEINLFSNRVSIDNFNQIIDEAHKQEKITFFDLLSKEYLDTFDRTYE